MGTLQRNENQFPMNTKADPNDVIARVSNNEPDTEYPFRVFRLFHTALTCGIVDARDKRVPMFIRIVTGFIYFSLLRLSDLMDIQALTLYRFPIYQAYIAKT